MNKIEKITQTLAIVVFSLMILGALCALLGQAGSKLISSGFFAYLLNVFSSPILILYQSFMDWTGGLLDSVFIIVALFGCVGLIGLFVNIFEKKNRNVASLVLAIVVFVLVVLCVYSCIKYGFGTLDAGVWSIVWLFAFLAVSVVWLALEIVNLVKQCKKTITK